MGVDYNSSGNISLFIMKYQDTVGFGLDNQVAQMSCSLSLSVDSLSFFLSHVYVVSMCPRAFIHYGTVHHSRQTHNNACALREKNNRRREGAETAHKNQHNQTNQEAAHAGHKFLPQTKPLLAPIKTPTPIPPPMETSHQTPNRISSRKQHHSTSPPQTPKKRRKKKNINPTNPPHYQH